MKLKYPNPVTVQGPSAETIQITAQMVVTHVARTGREFGQAGDLERVRMGKRILDAVEAGDDSQSGDLNQADVDELRKALIKPSRGWVSVLVEITMPAISADGMPRKVVRQLVPSAIDLLPLLNGLLA